MAKLRVAQELIDFFYPVGSVYISMNSISPQTLFGGTWVQIKDRFLYCTTISKTTGGASSVSYTPAGSISGSVGWHTLTEYEIPSHRHYIYQDPHGNGSRYAVVTNYGDSGGDQILRLGGTSGPSGLWPGSGVNAKGLVNADYTGGNGSHNHDFSGSFSGTSSSIATMPPWISCYAWYRTA